MSQQTILVLFFFSGAASLVYQVVWVRHLTLVLGSTAFAVSVVLAAFMSGLGLGSHLAGRLARRPERGLVTFGALEGLVGLYAVAFPWLLSGMQHLYVVASASASPAAVRWVQVALALAVLVPGSSLMGATLPVLSGYGVRRFADVGLRLGSLYAWNTAGAVAGCLAAGVFGIPVLGLRLTTLAAAATNFGVAYRAIVLGRSSAEAAAAPPPAADVSPVGYPEAFVRRATLAFAVSGFAGLGLEVVWTRLYVLTFSSATYSFTFMLASVLVGIAAGSRLSARFVDRSADPLGLLGILQLSTAVAILATTPLFLNAREWVSSAQALLGGGWAALVLVRLLAGFVVLIVPALLFGAAFPAAARIAARRLDGIAAAVGRLYAANVAGGVAGALVAAFVLTPLVGSDGTFRVMALAIGLAGAWLACSTPLRPLGARLGAVLALVVAGGVALASAPRELMLEIHRRKLAPFEELVLFREGAESTVLVGREPKGGLTRLLITGDQAQIAKANVPPITRFQGILPFLFERAPRRVLAICFGTGVTFGTVAQFDLDRVDGVEISPQVLDAAPLFAEENYDVLHDPRLMLHRDDGRNFLLKSRERYDAVTMEPMHPAVAGVVNLYTREFYELVRAHLNEGGVISQWVPLYQLDVDDVRTLFRTFAESFPHAFVFFYAADVFLVGSDRPLDLSERRFDERVRSERLRKDLAPLGLDRGEAFLATFVMSRSGMLRFADSARILTDDLPRIEFTAPRAAAVGGYGTVNVNVQALAPFAESGAEFVAADEPPGRLRDVLDFVKIRWLATAGRGGR